VWFRTGTGRVRKDELGLGVGTFPWNTSAVQLSLGTVTVERLKLFVFRIIPGNRGKVGAGWLARLLLNWPKGRVAEAKFTGFSGAFARAKCE